MYVLVLLSAVTTLQILDTQTLWEYLTFAHIEKLALALQDFWLVMCGLILGYFVPIQACYGMD